ncbi:MAG: hypothetical protein WCO35_00240 [Candidatus Nomurabacteria bacterium]
MEFGKFNLSLNKKEKVYDYKYFTNKENRKNIYEFGKGVTEYLHKEKITNLILLDRSPRPLWVAVDEYWKTNYKEEKRPDIYFINPDAFNNLNSSGMESFFKKLIYSLSDTSENEELNEEFDSIYKKLGNEKDKPLAIFDNCIHSGDTIEPVIDFLKDYGFKDIRILIGDTSANFSSVNIDKYCTDNAIGLCSVFGKDFGIYKDNEILSKYYPTANRDRVVQSRKEVRQIIRDKGR